MISKKEPQRFFGEAYQKLAQLHDLLTQEGITKGLIGPKEVTRLWERHIFNSATVVKYIEPSMFVSRETIADGIEPAAPGPSDVQTLPASSPTKAANTAIPPKGSNQKNVHINNTTEKMSSTIQLTQHVENSACGKVLVDVGSGAGFPGVVIACMLPKLQVYLIESMRRRVDWLFHVKQILKLDNVEIIRGRAEDVQNTNTVPSADFVTARAVAPLYKLLPWTMPFLKDGGELLALKGNSVQEEIQAAQSAIKKYTSHIPEVLETSVFDGAESTIVLRLKKQ